MKQLAWKVVLPMSLISMITFTKWWYASVEEAPNTMMWGFPFISVSQGWHTSMSFKIFIAEMLANFLFYVSCWLALTWFVDRFVVKLVVPQGMIILLWAFALVLLLALVWLGSMSDHIYEVHRGFSVDVLDAGYRFFWEDSSRPSQ